MNKSGKEKSKLLGFGGTLMLIIDVVLLAIIVASLVTKDKAVPDSSSRDVATTQTEYDKKATEEPEEDDMSVSETTDPPQPLDTDGIEGIVDIEDDVVTTSSEDDTVSEPNEDIFNLSDYSTTQRPSLSDFMWYFDNVHYNGIPSEATYIYDSEQIVGDWKGFIFYDPERKMNSYGIEFLNVNLKIDGQKADVAFDLYELHFENTEVINEEGGPLLNYSGNFEAGAVYATGGGNVHIDTFYTMPDKKQYAVGYLDTPDGTPAYLALVRP